MTARSSIAATLAGLHRRHHRPRRTCCRPISGGPASRIRPQPEVTGTSVRFVQTVGGRMGLPTPRRVPHKPFVQFRPSIARTTLALTMPTNLEP